MVDDTKDVRAASPAKGNEHTTKQKAREEHETLQAEIAQLVGRHKN